MFSGMPRSCADMTCVRRSPLWTYVTDVNSNQLFQDGQYILGDSGYQALPHVVCAFKRADTIADKEDFNTCVAQCRVTNEHCIGVLKSRWHSLKQIQTQINEKKDSAWMVRWIHLCGKLHNFVMTMNDEWTPQDEENYAQAAEEVHVLLVNDPGTAGGIGRVSRRGLVAAGNELLQTVMASALEFNCQRGRFLYRAM